MLVNKPKSPINITAGRTATAILAVTLMISFGALAITPEEQGYQIAEAVDVRDKGFADSVASVRMELTNAAGESVSRDLTIYNLEVDNDGDKSITLFNSPQDVKGTALLTWSHALDADEQWLFLPALKRVKRISSKNKSGPFMGSEFAFEDLASQELAKYRYEYLGSEPFNGIDTFVVKRYPQYENSGYSHQISWIDQSTLNILKTEYYDRSERHLKTLLQENYRKYSGQIWRSHLMTMINHQSGKKTTLTWGEYQFGNGLTDSWFNQNRLKNLR